MTCNVTWGGEIRFQKEKKRKQNQNKVKVDLLLILCQTFFTLID